MRMRGLAAAKDDGLTTAPRLYHSSLRTRPLRRSIGKWIFWNWLLSHKTERYNLLGASRARFPKRSGFMECLDWIFLTACVSRRGVISVMHLAARDFALHHIVSTRLFYYFYPSAPTHTHEFRKFQKCLSKNSIKYGWA